MPPQQVALTGSNNEMNEGRVQRVVRQEEEEASTMACVCQYIIRSLFPSDSSGAALVRQGKQLLNDSKFLFAVMCTSYELLLPEVFLHAPTDRRNRGVLAPMYSRECDTIARQLAEPLLNKPTIASSVPDNSMGIRVGKAYAAKFLALVNELNDMGRAASANCIAYDARMDFERSLILWREWCLAYSCPHQHRERLLHHLRTVSIPMMFDLELSRPLHPAARMLRENYCDILHELSGMPVTLEDVRALHDTAYHSVHRNLRDDHYDGYNLPPA